MIKGLYVNTPEIVIGYSSFTQAWPRIRDESNDLEH